MAFTLPINVKMPTFVGILSFISMINTTSETTVYSSSYIIYMTPQLMNFRFFLLFCCAGVGFFVCKKLLLPNCVRYNHNFSTISGYV